MPVQVIYIAASLLLIAAAPLPYGYYTFLRIVATVVFVWAGVIAWDRKHVMLAVSFGLMAVLFNPVLKVHFSKELWVAFDLVAAAVLLVTSRKIKL
ncbi:MAG: hypothetical protein Q7K57_17510 [Burkholderiaceae bacterium]|nr:hypothetical protein [Burkholderiaceae bacterium]